MAANFEENLLAHYPLDCHANDDTVLGHVNRRRKGTPK